MPDEPRWGLGDAALGFGLGFFAQAIAASAVVNARGVDDVTDLSITTILFLQLPLWLGLAGVPLLATWRKGNGPRRDLGLAVRPIDLPLAAAVGVILQALVVPALYWPVFRLFRTIDEDDVSRAAEELVDTAHGAGEVVLLVVMVAVLAPIAEELFFRGLLLRALERRVGTPVAALLSALLFALSHFQSIQLPALFLVGFVAAMLVVRTGRLWTAIVAHTTFNGWAVLTLVTDWG